MLDGGADGDGILGGGGDDVIRGDGDSPAAVQGNDNMAGGAGDDVLDGGGNGDLMLGGTGRDLLRYDASARTEGVVVTLDGLCNDGSPADVFAPPPPLQGLGFRDPETGLQVRCAANGADRDNAAPDIEQVTGTAFADDITGTGADELLVGGPGNDELEGAGGVDQLFGRGGSDTLLARDERADATISCDGDVVPTGPGGADRAVVDAVDPVEPDCETVERGGAGREGPIGGGLPPVAFPPGPPAPPSQVLVPPPPPFIAVPPQIRPSDQGAGRGAGGGDGRRAPQLRITSPVATIQRDGVATFRARCVYRAAQCVGRATLTLARRTPARVGGRRVVLPAGRRLASAPVRIPWGTSRPVRMRVGGLTITGPGAIRARLEVRARDSGFPRGPEARAVRAVLLGARR
ncbi:MAG: hypothetical protein MUE51_01525 [Thermoleophilia bacterium]|nr:hypothetical protein [Thermoleophilia bacterium]